MRVCALALTTTTLLLAAACQTGPAAAVGPPSVLPSYAELASRYNRNLTALDRFWSRAVVELTWRDDDGSHHEQGDGNLIIVLPDQVALSIGKLGNAMLWAGCNARQYWLFDLRDEPELFTGTHRSAYVHGTERLPIPVQPLDLLSLLGLVPMPPADEPVSASTVVWADDCLRVQPPGQNRRLWLDPKSARPKRIELLDESGQTRVACLLSRWQPVIIDGRPPGGFPRLATRLEVSVIGSQESTLTLFLSDLTDGRAENKIKARAFDLDHLIQLFKPRQVTDLDRRAPVSQPSMPIGTPESPGPLSAGTTVTRPGPY